jgi:hypothetical protein
MALSHAPTNFTAYKNLEIETLTNMTSFESNHSNAFDFDSIRMEIWQPALIVLPIPENRSGINTYVEIGVYITNNARTSLRFNPVKTLIPELLISEELLQRFLVTNESPVGAKTSTLDSSSLRFKLTRLLSKLTTLFDKSDCRLVEANSTETIGIYTKLFWHNNLLHLEFYTNDYRFFSSNRYWFFDTLQPEKYQLRFIYSRSYENRTQSSSREIRTTQQMMSEQLATPLVNFYLLQPVGTERNAVEVDGIRFETVVPQKLLIISEKEREAETCIQIGMCITNTTQTPFRFDFFDTLIPELLGRDGRALKRSYFCLGLQSSRKSDYPLAMPGECVTHFPDAKLLWFNRDHLRLKIAAGDGGFWIFDDLQPGVYQFRFVYRKHNSFVKINHKIKRHTKTFNWKWKSMVITPLLQLSISNQND